MISPLSYLLLPEIQREKAQASVPIMLERNLPDGSDPCLVTTTRGDFVVTRRTREGVYRFAFFRCPPEEETQITTHLFESLLQVSTGLGWSNRYPDLPSAMKALDRLEFESRTVILSKTLAGQFLGPDVQEGQVSYNKGLQVLVAPLPEGCAIVAAPPPSLGVYTRVGDYLGLQLTAVDQRMLLVSPHGNVAR